MDLFSIPAFGQVGEVELVDRIGDVELRFAYYDDANRLWRAGFRFRKVRAYQFRNLVHCSVAQVEAYDRLTLLEESEWLDELKRVTEAFWQKRWMMNHYRIFFQDVGCYDVIADSWHPIPAEPVDETRMNQETPEN